MLNSKVISKWIVKVNLFRKPISAFPIINVPAYFSKLYERSTCFGKKFLVVLNISCAPFDVSLVEARFNLSNSGILKIAFLITSAYWSPCLKLLYNRVKLTWKIIITSCLYDRHCHCRKWCRVFLAGRHHVIMLELTTVPGICLY